MKKKKRKKNSKEERPAAAGVLSRVNPLHSALLHVWCRRAGDTEEKEICTVRHLKSDVASRRLEPFAAVDEANLGLMRTRRFIFG